jgi:hypothetical protein
MPGVGALAPTQTQPPAKCHSERSDATSLLLRGRSQRRVAQSKNPSAIFPVAHVMQSKARPPRPELTTDPAFQNYPRILPINVHSTRPSRHDGCRPCAHHVSCVPHASPSRANLSVVYPKRFFVWGIIRSEGYIRSITENHARRQTPLPSLSHVETYEFFLNSGSTAAKKERRPARTLRTVDTSSVPRCTSQN